MSQIKIEKIQKKIKSLISDLHEIQYEYQKDKNSHYNEGNLIEYEYYKNKSQIYVNAIKSLGEIIKNEQ